MNTFNLRKCVIEGLPSRGRPSCSAWKLFGSVLAPQYCRQTDEGGSFSGALGSRVSKDKTRELRVAVARVPNYPRLYDKQRDFVDDSARYTLCEAGTKSGKTLACATWLVARAWSEPETEVLQL